MWFQIIRSLGLSLGLLKMKSDFLSKLSPFSSLSFHIYFPYGLFPILSFFLLFCSSIVSFFKINFWEASFWNPWTQGGQRAMCMHPQLCPTLCDPMDHSLPGSSLHGGLQVRMLEWVAITYSRESSWPRDWTHVSCISCIAGRFLSAESWGNPQDGQDTLLIGFWVSMKSYKWIHYIPCYGIQIRDIFLGECL